MKVKEKAELRRSDVLEMYDRAKFVLLDLMAIANDKGIDIAIHIDDDGTLEFQTYEYAEDYYYTKTIRQNAEINEYSEAERKKYGKS